MALQVVDLLLHALLGRAFQAPLQLLQFGDDGTTFVSLELGQQRLDPGAGRRCVVGMERARHGPQVLAHIIIINPLARARVLLGGLFEHLAELFVATAHELFFRVADQTAQERLALRGHEVLQLGAKVRDGRGSGCDHHGPILPASAPVQELICAREYVIFSALVFQDKEAIA